uniref:Uncharacterized protein n=1 Tax=Timema poppense TaxID=170557 RepID=A0A7R9CKC0_TIMPO|nr:unnamed protein product [Timema poppensis]
MYLHRHAVRAVLGPVLKESQLLHETCNNIEDKSQSFHQKSASRTGALASACSTSMFAIKTKGNIDVHTDTIEPNGVVMSVVVKDVHKLAQFYNLLEADNIKGELALWHQRQEVEIQNVGDESTDQNNNITMTSEDLLQPGHVVKERWKVTLTKMHDPTTAPITKGAAVAQAS